MALNAESLCSILLLCALLTGCAGQTFQYSRGWVNGKRSGVAIQPTKVADHLISNEEMPEMCKQFFLSDQLANPIAVRITALNPLAVHPFYQGPQMKHESDLLASTILPYEFIETPLTPSANAIDLTERFKRNAKTNA